MPVESTVSAAAQIAHQRFTAVADNDNGLAFLVGQLRGELVGLRDDMAEMRANDQKADTSRELMHEKMDSVDRRMEKLEGTVTVMGGVVAKQTTRIDKIEPLALWLIAIAGGLMLVGGALWFGVMNYGTAVVQWLSAQLPKQ